MLGKLRGNPPKNSFCNLWNLQLPADLSIGIRLASFVHGNLQSRIFNLLRQFDKVAEAVASLNLWRATVDERHKIGDQMRARGRRSYDPPSIGD